MQDIKTFTGRYFDFFKQALDSITVTRPDGSPVEYQAAMQEVCSLITKLQSDNKQVMMVGNGGSAGICSHQVVDYWKNGNIKATAFNDSSLLTCISNDYSYEEVFSKPIEMFGSQGDLLFCISSSGSSMNIRNAADAGKARKCNVVTFSGFDEKNPLRSMGLLNFYVKSNAYGAVEILHLFIIHSILDAYLFVYQNTDVFNKNKPLKS